LKQRAVTEFLSAENVKPPEIHCRLQAVYGENTVNMTTIKSIKLSLNILVSPMYSTWKLFGAQCV
jgi:hypothetical protein